MDSDIFHHHHSQISDILQFSAIILHGSLAREQDPECQDLCSRQGGGMVLLFCPAAIVCHV